MKYAQIRFGRLTDTVIVDVFITNPDPDSDPMYLGTWHQKDFPCTADGLEDVKAIIASMETSEGDPAKWPVWKT